MKKNIVLIGMPGVGKSTVGVVLAKALGYNFLDSDLLIQHKYNMLLSDIMKRYGIDEFIRIEDEVNSGIETENTVIATGGSVIYGEKAMGNLKDIGVVIYLKLPYEEIENRLGSLEERGVVMKEGQNLADLYNERCVLYERYADITIETDGMSIKETVEQVRKQLYFA